MSDLHGGSRPGAGRKAAANSGRKNDYERLVKAKADHEAQRARIAQMKADETAGLLITADEATRCIATAFATVANTLRTIPDNLERHRGVGPEIAEAVEIEIDAVLEQLANRLGELAPEHAMPRT